MTIIESGIMIQTTNNIFHLFQFEAPLGKVLKCWDNTVFDKTVSYLKPGGDSISKGWQPFKYFLDSFKLIYHSRKSKLRRIFIRPTLLSKL